MFTFRNGTVPGKILGNLNNRYKCSPLANNDFTLGRNDTIQDKTIDNLNNRWIFLHLTDYYHTLGVAQSQVKHLAL